MLKIAIILARQNSKGVPLKNLTQVGGITLLGRAILSAQESGVFDKIIVSTDGDLIIKEAEKYHNVTIVRRPAILANDTATSISGVLHVLDELVISTGIVCLLQPTSPLRTAKHIQESFALFQQQQYQGSVISACLTEHHPYKCVILNNDGYEPVHSLEDLESPRQKLPKAFRPNGAIYFSSVEMLQTKQRFFNTPISLYEMSEVESIDIDTVRDLEFANQILGK